MKTIFFLFLFAAGGALMSQTTPVISPEVINSAGDHRQVGTGNFWISDNVGEPFTETVGTASLMVTQGFLQPPMNDGTTILINGVTCATRKDGFISIAYSSAKPGHREQYIWSAGACPSNNCGSKVENLAPGDYFVTIISSYTVNGVVKSDTVHRGPIAVAGSAEPCRLVVYTGVTPNRDGNNDTWTIENISEFPNNRVTIYNRWGLQLFDANGYDNTTIFWPTTEMLDNLISSTYFYIIDLGDGSKPLKGWVELIKN